MKRLRILFLVLFGLLFISVTEAKTDIQNDGFEVVINTLDFDLVIDYTIIETVNYSNYLVINVSRDITIKQQKMNLGNCSNSLNELKAKAITTNETNLSTITRNKEGGCLDTGELNKSVNYNYTNSRNKNKKFKIPLGLRYRHGNSTII